MGSGEINALYESWLEVNTYPKCSFFFPDFETLEVFVCSHTSICMTYVINRRSQFEKGVNELKDEVEGLKKQVVDKEAEICKLNTELDSQKETFEQTSKAVKDYDMLKENNKMVIEDLHATTIDRNAKQKKLNELKLKLSGVEKKGKRLACKLVEVSSRESDFEVEHDKFLEAWKRSPEGHAFLGKMASRFYCMAVRDTKERLKGILVGFDSSLDWNAVEVEFDSRIAEEQRVEAEKAAAEESAKGYAPQSSTSKAPEVPNQAATPSKPPEAPIKDEPENLMSGSSDYGDDAGSTYSSPDKTHAA